MINFTFQDVSNYIFSIAPLLIAWFFVMGSIFNNTIAKGLIYLVGVLVVIISTAGLKRLFKTTKPNTWADTCQTFSIPLIDSNFSAPDFNSMLLAFTTMYVLMPMAYGATKLNALLIVMLSTFIVGNAVTRYNLGCNNIFDIILGVILGGVIGIIWFYIWWSSDNKELLFMDTLNSNNVMCDRPSEQKFKCAVYKNGQLIKNL
jgi:hypothetical protein